MRLGLTIDSGYKIVMLCLHWPKYTRESNKLFPLHPVGVHSRHETGRPSTKSHEVIKLERIAPIGRNYNRPKSSRIDQFKGILKTLSTPYTCAS
jgi:hypothetical protein